MLFFKDKLTHVKSLLQSINALYIFQLKYFLYLIIHEKINKRHKYRYLL